MQLFLVAIFAAVCYTGTCKRTAILWGQKEKLIAKMKNSPKSFTFDDAETLLSYFSYPRNNKGRTSGSRVMFSSPDHGAKILLHVPHPQKELREYQVKQLIELLEQEGLL